MKKKILIGILFVFVVMQSIRIDTTPDLVAIESDFLNLTNAPDSIVGIVNNSCYDCHSNDTKYSWYSNVAPVSWLVRNHIKEGREHINFSNWKSYPPSKQSHIIEECIEEIKEDEMPLKSYVLIHSKAKLTPKSKNQLIEWLKNVNVGHD